MIVQIKLKSHFKKSIGITKLCFVLLALLVFNSCWNNPGESDIIIGNYVVEWNDLVANRWICEKPEKNSPYCNGIISNYVFAVGHNSDFIIAKQHPNLNDLSITKYFIIDLNKRKSGNGKSLIGPMEKLDFDKKTIELNISDLKFDQNYPENPN